MSASRKKAIFTWGRMNPPTVGHKALIDQMLIRAQELGADPFIVVTHSQNKVKNPLTPAEKQDILKNMYPRVQILASSRQKPNPVFLVNELRELGYDEIFFILGSDRDENFGFVKNITRLPGIKRNQKAEGAIGMSGTKARNYAVARDRTGFRSAINSSISNAKLNTIMSTIQERLQ